MNAKKRWYELLLPGMAILLVFVAGTVKNANAYDYIQDEWVPYEYASDLIWNPPTSSYQEWAYATAIAEEEYECQCTAEAFAKAKDDRADANADSQASWFTDWTWDGPPESNKPGGELAWFHNAYGDWTGTWGYNTTSGISISSAGGDSWSFAEEDSAYADIDVFGYIMYGSIVTGYSDWDVDPIGEFDEGTVTEYDTPPNYAFHVDGWSLETSGMEIIPSGTTYFFFIGGVSCDANTTTISTEETENWAESNGEAKAYNDVYADFDSY